MFNASPKLLPYKTVPKTITCELHPNEKVHVNEPQYFRGTDEGWAWIREGKVALVTGVSMDAKNGLINYARDNGLQVVVMAPERPGFMHAQDWFVEGRAEDILPKLTRLLTT